MTHELTPELPPDFPIEREPSWGYTDLLIFTCLSLICIVIGQLLMHGMAVLFHVDPRNDGTVVLASQMLLYGMLFAVLYAIIKLQYGREFWQSLGWVPSRVNLGSAALIGLALAFTVAILGSVLHTPDVDTPMKHLLAKRATAIEFAILGSTLAPLCEELIFRGFMQPVLVRSLGALPGILLTAAVFGALHLSQYAFAWQSGLLVTLAGAAFGWMRYAAGSTRASVCMHACYNLTFFLTLFAQGKHLPT
ncbi:MAG: Abortive infection protein [Bryobacterales bacterium]|nr:Abortive infection protein [Bryobacterales bacterium]